MNGKIPETYKKRRLQGGLLGLFKGFVSATIALSILGSSLYTITGGTGEDSNLVEHDFENETVNTVYSIYRSVDNYGSTGIIKLFNSIKNKEDVVLFHRTIPKEAVSKAVAVTSISFIVMFTSTVLLSAVTDAPALDIMYETISATATVGLTRNLTSSLNLWGKIILVITMYLGRVGPISLLLAFNKKTGSKNIIKNPTEEISIG